MDTFSDKEKAGLNKFIKKHSTKTTTNPKSFMGADLTKKGSKHFGKYFGANYKSIKSSLPMFGIGMALNVPRHMREGKSLPGAIGRSALSSARLMMFPETFYGPMLGNAIAGLPGKLQEKAQQKDFVKNYSFLGGDYIDQQASYSSRARAVEHIKRSRTSVQSGLGREARRYHN